VSAEAVRAAALVGHAFGNQHVPVDVQGTVLRMPVTTSEEIARATVAALGLDGVAVSFADAAHRPAAAHHHPH
jgi:urease accessory protein